MQENIVVFLFQWIAHIVEACGQSLPDAIQTVIRQANDVITIHNLYKGQHTASQSGLWSDNQCVFSTMLLDDIKYDSIPSHIASKFSIVEDEDLEDMRKAKELSYYDKESGHQDADRILLRVLDSNGYGKLVEEYRKVSKWYA